MPAPGVVNHKYTDAPLDPQVKLFIVVVRIPRNLRYIRGESSMRKSLIYRSHLHEYYKFNKIFKDSLAFHCLSLGKY